jgi:broad specificity phosphatase PhoE
MKLFFTRHGESEANTRRIISNRDLPLALTANGREQALMLAFQLRDKPLVRIYTSPIPRATETAVIIARQLNMTVERVDALREPDCGLLEGRADQAAWDEHAYWTDAWLQDHELESGPAGGETCLAVRKRMAGFIACLIDVFGNTGSEFLLVTHGALLLFCLPGLVQDVDYRYILEHGLDHLVLIETELKDRQLICQQWERL